VSSVAHQPSSHYSFAPWVDRRNRVACRQPDELIAATEEERVSTNHKAVCLHLAQRFKNRLDLAFRARMQDTDLETERTCRHLYFWRLGGCSCESRVDKRGNDVGPGSQIMQRLQFLSSQSVNKEAHARYFSTRPAKAGYYSNFDRIDTIRKPKRDF